MSEAECEEWILETIDSLRSRKARPDEERICRLVARRHGLSPSRARRELERLLRSRAVLRVSYKGSHSYRNAGKWRPARRGEPGGPRAGGDDGAGGGGETAAATGRSRRSGDQGDRVRDLPDRSRRSADPPDRTKRSRDRAGRARDPEPDRARRSADGSEQADPPEQPSGSGDQAQAEPARAGAERGRRSGDPGERRDGAGDPGDVLVGALRELGELEGAGVGIGEISRLMSDRQRVLTRAQLRTALEWEVNQGRIRRTPEGNYTLSPVKRRLRAQAIPPQRKTRRTKEVDTPASAEERAGQSKEDSAKQASEDEACGAGDKERPPSDDSIDRPADRDGPDEKEVSVGKHPVVEPGNPNTADKQRLPVSPRAESLRAKMELQTVQEPPGVGQTPGKDETEFGSTTPEELSTEAGNNTSSARKSCVSQGKESSDVSVTGWETFTEGLTHSTEQRLTEASESVTCLQQGTRLTEGPCLSCDSKLLGEDGTMLLPRLPSATASPKHQLLEAAAEDSSSNSRHSVSEVGAASCLLTPSASPVEMVPEENGSTDRHRLEENGKPLDPTEWSIADVVNYFKEAGFPDQAKAFEDQEIDGKSLLLMKRNDVLTGLEIKLGPALKIYEYHIKVLQLHHFNNEATSC
eukprot:gi/632985165/ref/XP_007909525.1/ PREDICTED: atherin-like [Callorhinchus milii]